MLADIQLRPNSSASSFEENKIYQGDHKALLASGKLWVYALMLRARRSWSTCHVTRLLSICYMRAC